MSSSAGARPPSAPLARDVGAPAADATRSNGNPPAPPTTSSRGHSALVRAMARRPARTLHKELAHGQARADAFLARGRATLRGAVTGLLAAALDSEERSRLGLSLAIFAEEFEALLRTTTGAHARGRGGNVTFLHYAEHMSWPRIRSACSRAPP